MNEAVDIVRGLSAGGYFEYHGDVYDLRSVKLSPTPTKPLPILIGGHAKAALRRAARSDGWLHGGGDPADLPGLLERLRIPRGGRHRRPAVRSPCHLGRRLYRRRHPQLEEQGVTDVIVGFRWPYAVGPDTEVLQTKLDNLRRFADDVMAKVRHDHRPRPARASMAAVEAGDRDAWLGLFADDAVVEDPIGP